MADDRDTGSWRRRTSAVIDRPRRLQRLLRRLADTEERFGGATIAMVVLLGMWLFVANALLLGGYQAVLEIDEPEGRDA